MQRIALAASTMVLLISQTAGAQERTDFSGIWKMDPSRSESAHQAVPSGPVTMVMKQTAAELNIETRREDKKSAASSETLTYPLDGSESTVLGKFGVPVKVKAHWDGAKLVTETERNVQGSTVTTVYVLSLDASRREMTIDKTLSIQHGYEFKGAKNTGAGKDVFIKRRR